MSIEDLRKYSMAYLATPYSLFHKGHDVAAREAASIAADLWKLGVHVFSPISHGHMMSAHGGLPFTDHHLWEDIDAWFVKNCDALIVVKMDGWDESYGIAHEVSEFKGARKPIYYLDPVSLSVS